MNENEKEIQPGLEPVSKEQYDDNRMPETLAEGNQPKLMSTQANEGEEQGTMGEYAQQMLGTEQMPVQEGNMRNVGNINMGQAQNIGGSYPNGASRQSGYSVTERPQSGSQYSFWQQQGGYVAPEQPYQYQQNFHNGYVPTPKKQNSGSLGIVGKGLAIGVAAAVGFSGVLFGVSQAGLLEKSSSKQQTINNIGSSGSISATVVSSGAIQTATDLSQVVEKCMPSIVSIDSTVTESVPSYFGTYDRDSKGSGSGIILKMSEDEILIVTNHHVIKDANKIVVGFHGMETEDEMVEATVKGTDSTRDLAVVLVKTKKIPKDILDGIKAIELGSSDDVRVGQIAIAIGNALGYGQSMTVGYISAKDRKVQVSEDETQTMTLLQTDAAINPGNSGGALLNSEGQLIGINSAKYSDTSVEGMGFAIPISSAISVINDLMEREVLTEEEKGYLGIKGTNIDANTQKQYPNMPIGVYVSEVSKDGAAEAAGIMTGDIIVGVDDEEILTIEALAEKVNSYRIGKEITLKVKRYTSGKYVSKNIKVKLKGKDTLNSIQDDKDASGNSGKQGSNNQGNNGSQGNGGDQNNGNTYGYDENDLGEFYKQFFGY